MLPVTQDQRDQLIGEFWSAVRARLMEAHHRSQQEADRGIGEYRYLIHRRGIGDLVYHQGAEKTAEVIDGILEHGAPSA